MSKLSDILYEQQVCTAKAEQKLCKTCQQLVGNSKQQIKELMLEIIGDDVLAEQYSNANPTNKYLVAENRLRRELRQKVEEL